MTGAKKILITISSFVAAIVMACIGNFILQVLVIFLDIVSRMSGSSAYVIVLWIVTGVFGAIFAVSIAEQFLGKNNFSHRFTGNVILTVSVLAILFAFILLSKGEFRQNPSEFSLLLSNGYVFLSFFAGSAAMAAILRNMD